MKLQFLLYTYLLSLCILPFSLYAFDSEIPVYDIKNHTIVGTYQRRGNINGYKSGIITKNDTTTLHAIEKPEQISDDAIGYITYKNIIRESSNSSKKCYLYQADLSDAKAEPDNPKKKHNHLMA